MLLRFDRPSIVRGAVDQTKRSIGGKTAKHTQRDPSIVGGFAIRAFYAPAMSSDTRKSPSAKRKTKKKKVIETSEANTAQQQKKERNELREREKETAVHFALHRKLHALIQ